jgi:hypothetical protein
VNEIAEEQKSCSQKLDFILSDIKFIKVSCEGVNHEFLNVSILIFYLYIFMYLLKVFIFLGYNQRGGKDGL